MRISSWGPVTPIGARAETGSAVWTRGCGSLNRRCPVHACHRMRSDVLHTGDHWVLNGTKVTRRPSDGSLRPAHARVLQPEKASFVADGPRVPPALAFAPLRSFASSPAHPPHSTTGLAGSFSYALTPPLSWIRRHCMVIHNSWRLTILALLSLKAWITNAHDADAAIVMATTDKSLKHKGASVA